MPTKKRKRKKFKTVILKLSARQNRSLENYCEARKTTPGKLIRKMIRPYTNGFDKHVPEEYFISEKQLNLFEEEILVEEKV